MTYGTQGGLQNQLSICLLVWLSARLPRSQIIEPKCALAAACALQATRHHFTPRPRPIDVNCYFHPFSLFLLSLSFHTCVLLTFSFLQTPRGLSVLGGSGSKEKLQAGSHAGSPDTRAGKSRQLVCVQDINNIEQHAGGNKEGRIEADSVLGNTGIESSKLFEEL